MKRWKVISTNVSIGVFFLLGGIEYAVIIPTLFNFVVNRFGGSNWMYGMILSAFSFAQLFSNPLMGYLCDRSKNAKWVVIFGNLFELGGNFLYFAAPSQYWLLGARLLCGFGAGAGSAILAQIARTSTVAERTKVFSLAMMARQCGMLLGPAFNVFLKGLHFKIGPFQVDAFTSPGIFMACLFLLDELMILFLYFDQPPLSKRERDGNQTSESTEKSPIIKSGRMNNYGTGLDEESQHTDPTVGINASCSINASSDDEEIRIKKPKKKGFLVGILREELIVLLTAQFVVFFNQTSFETLVIPLTEELLGWGELANSIMYGVVGLLAIIVFLLITIISKKIEDRWLMVIGIVAQTFSLVWDIGFFGQATRHTPTNLMAFIISTFFIVSGVPFFIVSSSSLFSKLTDEETQGLTQGFRRAIASVATIFGPLYAGGLIHNLYATFGVMAGLVVFLAIILFMSFKTLREPSKQRRKTAELNEDSQ
ncbi:uncharacterized protein TRIADDRAFT_60061 [Trichoplax adhaerens]|uniref:Major facilitator superfamily (MFS) profile domain-containing protein n=1 Tax=Trichoplax adhaerens TaxID=10228 RepID=B3S768_TRIAD|nr:hypothetical protein TRIADDRAFT_60061 [Trichoplax adhaerens]EDV21517.1 hypothetical protein TRIADDRAFT_60061 [Trichoplax adhaerens]|eukprot:XP_002116117.1 hypothetical protein TRIADDRAFT_60061 [Trichoplax adhaerens]